MQHTKNEFNICCNLVTILLQQKLWEKSVPNNIFVVVTIAQGTIKQSSTCHNAYCDKNTVHYGMSRVHTVRQDQETLYFPV